MRKREDSCGEGGRIKVVKRLTNRGRKRSRENEKEKQSGRGW